MTSSSTGPSFGELTELRRFTGPAREFWPRFAAAVADVCGADRCIIAVKQGAGNATWRKLHDWTHNDVPAQPNAVFAPQLISAADRAASEGILAQALPVAGAFIIGAKLPLPGAGDVAVALLLLTSAAEPAAREALARLQMAADTPLLYQQAQAATQAQASTEKFAGTLDVLAQFNEQTRFHAASLALCNALATRFGLDRVSLGWMHGPTLKLKCISRTENFSRQMAAAQALEAAMEEAVDQNADILFPAAENPPYISHDHARFSKEQGVPNLASFPLRAGSAAVGCLTAERSATAFTDLEVQQLRLTVDLAARRLADLQRHDRWFGARWMIWWKELLAKAIGPQHTWAKLLALVIFVALLLLVFLKLPYRVEANFLLKTEDVAFISAPFDSFLSEVLVRPGDLVTNGQPIARLDKRDLLLEESSAMADMQRYQREAEKARAAHSLAEMRIADALAQQSQARLQLVRHRLDQSEIRAPFHGAVIEGDLRERLGAPVRQGDNLFRVAKLKGLYVVADVPERDIHELRGTESGEIAFYSQPRLKFPIQGRILEPAATTKENANVFQYRCDLATAPEAWFRPGMGGIAKINVGKRRLIWIVTHRTVDFLRLYFWW